MTTVKIEEECDIEVAHMPPHFDGQPLVILTGEAIPQEIWLSAGEARELIKALKKHIKKAEGK